LIAATARAAALAAAIVPAVATAHLQFGAAEFYGAVVHPWINLESGLILFALCLWVAQWLSEESFLPFGAIVVPLAAAALVGVVLRPRLPPPAAYACMIGVGALVAVRFRPPLMAGITLAACASAYAGLVAGTDAAPDVAAPLTFAGGVALGAFVFPLLVIGLLLPSRNRIVDVGTRILGSWIAAIGLMLFALALRH
jgi:hydrogenase/urease accessory protein HupE